MSAFTTPATHGAIDTRMASRAQALRDDAAEIAHRIGQTPVHQHALVQGLIREHQGLLLRAIAADQIAAGNLTLARTYIATAKWAEAYP